MQGTVIECFVNEQCAQTCHLYNYSDGRLSIGAIGGEMRVESLEIKKPSGKK